MNYNELGVSLFQRIYFWKPLAALGSRLSGPASLLHLVLSWHLPRKSRLLLLQPEGLLSHCFLVGWPWNSPFCRRSSHEVPGMETDSGGNMLPRWHSTWDAHAHFPPNLLFLMSWHLIYTWLLHWKEWMSHTDTDVGTEWRKRTSLSWKDTLETLRLLGLWGRDTFWPQVVLRGSCPWTPGRKEAQTIGWKLCSLCYCTSLFTLSPRQPVCLSTSRKTSPLITWRPWWLHSPVGPLTTKDEPSRHLSCLLPCSHRMDLTDSQ